MDELAGRSVIVDCRSSGYAAMWSPSGSQAARWLAVRVVREVAGRRSVVSHLAKLTRGQLTRHLVTSPTAPRTVQQVAELAARRLRGGALPARATRPAVDARRRPARGLSAMWWASLLAAAAALVTRLLPVSDAESILRRIAPVLVFLVAITVVAQLAQNAGVFDAAAHLAARLGRGRTWALWLLIVLLATRLDDRALAGHHGRACSRPVALALAVQVGISPALFAMTTVWLADTASMLLPVSNLTNLLALHRFQALGVDVRRLRRRQLAACAGLGPGDGGGAGPHVPPGPADPLRAARPAARRGPGAAVVRRQGCASRWRRRSPSACSRPGRRRIAAVLLVALFAVRRPSDLHASHVPWRLVLLVIGLFFVVQTLQVHGLPHVLARIAGTGETWPDHLRLATTGALSANGFNNLPAYLALEPVADSSAPRLVALLLGVNCGPPADALGLARDLAVARAVPGGGRRGLDPPLLPARAGRRPAAHADHDRRPRA